MSPARIRTVVELELAQRVRSVAWYVLLGIFAFVMITVTVVAYQAWAWSNDLGGAVYSTIAYVVLLLVVLVSPTLSGNAINGDRDAATLAPVQVSFATTGEILLGKLLAAWITGLAFLAVASPFMVVALVSGGLSAGTLITSLVVLVVEIGVFAAIGVALSGLIARPLFSIAATYLVVAAFVIGTLIAFGLGGASIRTEVTTTSRYLEPAASCGIGTDDPDCTNTPGETDWVCSEWQSTTYETPRFDRVWWILAANPFVVLADATPMSFDRSGNPSDLFGQISSGVRISQIPPETEAVYDGCGEDGSVNNEYVPTEDRVVGTTPSWFVGLLVQLAVAAVLVWGAWARTRTPARALPPGTRVA